MSRHTLGDGACWGVRLRYVFDGSRAMGTGGAVRKALPELGGGKAGLMTVCRNDDRWDRSNVLFADGRIVRYDNKNRTSEMRPIDYGVGAFRKAALAGRSAGEAPGRFYEIGSRAGLEETRAYLAAKGMSAR